MPPFYELMPTASGKWLLCRTQEGCPVVAEFSDKADAQRALFLFENSERQNQVVRRSGHPLSDEEITTLRDVFPSAACEPKDFNPNKMQEFKIVLPFRTMATVSGYDHHLED